RERRPSCFSAAVHVRAFKLAFISIFTLAALNCQYNYCANKQESAVRHVFLRQFMFGHLNWLLV
ncbi:MAG: hypothetical protein RRY69_07305, partial [Oscillospiraceae bacterium]